MSEREDPRPGSTRAPAIAPPRPKTTLFVTGTDTGIGKTLVAVALVRRLRALGIQAIGVKPVETGCTYGKDNDLVAHDGERLHLAAERCVPPLVVAPYRFVPPIAPALAAERAGIGLALSDLVAAVEAGFRFGELVVVEAAGGALSPMAEDGLALDLAERLGATILVIAPDRLGVQSHALCVLEAARRRALNLGGVLLSRASGDDAVLDAQANAALIARWGGATVFPTLGPATGTDAEKVSFAETHLAEHAVAERLLEAARRP